LTDWLTDQHHHQHRPLSACNKAIFSPIFSGYRTATGDRLDAQGAQELLDERKATYVDLGVSRQSTS
jgi:hypothetical protein